MVGDIETTFSQWINHNRDNKGKRPENGQNRRDLGGGENKSAKRISNVWNHITGTNKHYPHKIFPISLQINLCSGTPIDK